MFGRRRDNKYQGSGGFGIRGDLERAQCLKGPFGSNRTFLEAGDEGMGKLVVDSLKDGR